MNLNLNTNYKRGSALIQVIIVLIIFSILGIGIISLWSAETFDNDKFNKRTKAYYLAKSGLEVARAKVNTPAKLNTCIDAGNMAFTLFGDLNSITGTGIPTGSEKIIAAVSITPNAATPSTTDYIITINSVGNEANVKSTVTGDFSYNRGGTSTEPSVPTPGTGGALSSNPGDLENGFLDWNNSSGVLDGNDHQASVPVVFDNPGSETGIALEANNKVVLTAPAMYFVDTLRCLYIKNSKTITLTANFISFMSDVEAGHDVKAELYLEVLDNVTIDGIQFVNTLTGNLIGGTASKKYGIVYLGAEVMGKQPGYYYFPDGVDIFSTSSTTGINALIRINDITAVPQSVFAKLGYTVTTEGDGLSGIVIH